VTEVPDPFFSETALAPQEGATAAVPPGKGGTAAVLWLFVRSRFLPALVTLWLISIIVFASTHVLGINVARRVLGREATPEQLAEFSRAHGLDKPIIDQYTSWLSDFVKGDWGISAASVRPVSEIVVPRTVNTLILALSAIVIALPIAIAFGIYMARPGSRARELTLTIANVSVAAIPVFVIGIVLIYALSVQLGWTPVDSMGMSFGSWNDKAAAFILPTLTLVISLIPHISRLT
jgi:peptide/nickel transport system permease protein